MENQKVIYLLTLRCRDAACRVTGGEKLNPITRQSRPYILWVKFYIVSENYMADYMAINVQMISVFVLFFS